MIRVKESDTFEIFNLEVKKAKGNKIIPKNFSMSESVINKYVGSFENLKKEINNG